MARRALCAAALLLLACNQGSGPPLPDVQPGAQAPSRQTRVSAPQADLSAEEREELRWVVNDALGGAQDMYFLGYAFQEFNHELGFAQPRFEDEIAALQPGTDHRWRITLEAGVDYGIVGGCDRECENLDLELIDITTGGVVASDMLPDDSPVLNYAPSATGDYIVRIMLQACDVAPCLSGARILTRSGGKPPGRARSAGDIFESTPPTVQWRLGRMHDIFGEYGAAVERHEAELAPGARQSWPIQLVADRAYTIYATCGEGCANVDLELIDSRSGRVVASDRHPDNYPVVTHVPAADGAYEARVTLQACGAALCPVGVQVGARENGVRRK